MGLGKDIYKAFKKSIKRNYYSLFGPHWHYVCDVTLALGRGTTVRVTRSSFRNKKVPKILKTLKFTPSIGDVNWVYVKGHNYRYKVVYEIPQENWKGNPQTLHQVMDDYTSARVYSKRRIGSIKREEKIKARKKARNRDRETVKGSYDKSYMGYPNPLAKNWKGDILDFSPEDLPAYWKGKKIKTWVLLTDDDLPAFGPIFYKKKNYRKHKYKRR